MLEKIELFLIHPDIMYDGLIEILSDHLCTNHKQTPLTEQ